MNITSSEAGIKGSADPERGGLRGFWALIVTQFQGAFSDNALKWLTVFLITQLNLPNGQRDRLVTIVGLLFAVPFILFSMTGGFLADRFSKRSVILGVKIFEIFVMSLALVGLATQPALPDDHLRVFDGRPQRDFRTVKIWIIAGTVAGEKAVMGQRHPGIRHVHRHHWWHGRGRHGSARHLPRNRRGRESSSLRSPCVGLMTGHWHHESSRRRPAKKIPRQLRRRSVGADKNDPPRPSAVAGDDRQHLLFFIAALIQFVIVIYAKDAMGINDPAQTSYLQAATAIGIGVGCFLAGFLSAGKIETGLIPLRRRRPDNLCRTAWSRRISLCGVAANLSALGFFGGFYIVPISAMLQYRPARGEKGRRAGGGKSGFLHRDLPGFGGFRAAHDRPEIVAAGNFSRHLRDDTHRDDLFAHT